jgi:hypothetical protein
MARRSLFLFVYPGNPVPPRFFVIHSDDLPRSHRCPPRFRYHAGLRPGNCPALQVILSVVALPYQIEVGQQF